MDAVVFDTGSRPHPGRSTLGPLVERYLSKALRDATAVDER